MVFEFESAVMALELEVEVAEAMVAMAEEEGTRLVGTTEEDIFRETEGARDGGASDLDLD